MTTGVLQMCRMAGRSLLLAAFVILSGGAALQAQPAPSGPPNALQGFSQNRDKPIDIHSDSLDVRDKDKVATFSGDVHLVQGDTTLRSKVLVVFYDNDASTAPPKPAGPPGAVQPGAASRPAGPTAAPGAPGAPQSQQIRRVEAKGNVIVVQKDQTATGETGIFDMRANTVTLQGNVMISQGQNVVKGDRLTVDMTTGDATVECDKSPKPCRVSALVNAGSMKPDGANKKPDGRGQGAAVPGAALPGAGPAREVPSRDAPRPRSTGPSGLY